MFRAPTDCVQYFTGTSGSVKSYNFQGSQFLKGQIYNNCVRTEKGYCAIQWKESSTTSPDPFAIGVNPTTQIESNGCSPAANAAWIEIPNLSQDGIQKLPVPVASQGFQSQQCGSNFGIEGMGTIAQPLVSKCCEKKIFLLSSSGTVRFIYLLPSHSLGRKQPFVLGVYSDNTAPVDFPGQTGFNMDYVQV